MYFSERQKAGMKNEFLLIWLDLNQYYEHAGFAHFYIGTSIERKLSNCLEYIHVFMVLYALCVIGIHFIQHVICHYLFTQPLVAAPPNKKRAWSWPSYLEEERAVAAPVKLFKEVKTCIYLLFVPC